MRIKVPLIVIILSVCAVLVFIYLGYILKTSERLAEKNTAQEEKLLSQSKGNEKLSFQSKENTYPDTSDAVEKPKKPFIVNGYEVCLKEGLNVIITYEDGVSNPRPLTREEIERLKQLKPLLLDLSISVETRAKYHTEMQEILKNARKPAFQETYIMSNKLPDGDRSVVDKQFDQMLQMMDQAMQERRPPEEIASLMGLKQVTYWKPNEEGELAPTTEALPQPEFAIDHDISESSHANLFSPQEEGNTVSDISISEAPQLEEQIDFPPPLAQQQLLREIEEALKQYEEFVEKLKQYEEFDDEELKQYGKLLEDFKQLAPNATQPKDRMGQILREIEEYQEKEEPPHPPRSVRPNRAK